MLLAIKLLDGTEKIINVRIVREIITLKEGFKIIHFNDDETLISQFKKY